MATAPIDINAIFLNQINQANTYFNDAKSAVGVAFNSFANAAAYAYTPYEWQTPSAPIVVFSPSTTEPIRPVLPGLDAAPSLKTYPTLPNLTTGSIPGTIPTAPALNFPSSPGGPPGENFGTAPRASTPHFPTQPAMLPLPSTQLPYTTLNLPTPPTWNEPLFDGQAPQDIDVVSVSEYMAMLTSSYATYADMIPAMVKAHWLDWYRAMLGENPLIDKIIGILGTYYDEGGAGIPTPIEEAIIARATDRITAEQRRSTMNVYEEAARRGLTLPGGMLVAGLREARQTAAEAVSKVVTDTAIKNLELEHDYMKFMLQLGVEFEKALLSFASDTAKNVLECNAQALEVTKLVLNGLIEINKLNVQIYLAKWEGYKAAVEIYKARWQAIEMQIRVYEAEIKAELAKTEINKAAVEVLTAIVGANTALVNMYKAGVDAETAKLEADKIAVQVYQALVQAYVARVEAYKAQWQGYAAGNEGQVARAKAYEAQVNGYTAHVNAYKVQLEAQVEHVKAVGMQVDAIGKENEQNLKAWQIKLDGHLRAYVAQSESYRAEWSAQAERLRGYANVAQIQGEFLSRMYTSEVTIDIEKSRSHLSEWQSQITAMLKTAEGLTQAASVSSNIAASALNGLTAFAGAMRTGAELSS